MIREPDELALPSPLETPWPEGGENVHDRPMSRHEGIEVPNDPHQHRPRGRFVRLHGPMPFVPISLALWLLLLYTLPAWMIGDLVVALLASCAAGALVPLLPGSDTGRSNVPIDGLAGES